MLEVVIHTNLPTVSIDSLPTSGLWFGCRFLMTFNTIYAIRLLSLPFSGIIDLVMWSLHHGRGVRVSELPNPSVRVALRKLPLPRVIPESLALEKWKTPATLGALSVDMLFAHAHPDRVIVG